MDRNYIHDNQVIERYLQGRLTMEEQDAFEALYLASPELLEEIEVARRLRQGVLDVDAIEQAAISEGSPDRSNNIFQSPRYAKAASVLLVVSLGFTGMLWKQNQDLTGPSQSRSSSGALVIPLLTTRSLPDQEPVNQLPLPTSGQDLVVLINPGFDGYDHYRAIVAPTTKKPNAEPWLFENLQPGYQGMLALPLHGSTIDAGDYEILVEGWRDNWTTDHEYEPVQRISFRVSDTP